MNNLDIRQIINKNRFRHYEVAHEMGISEYTLSVWLRSELPPDKRERVLHAISQLSEERDTSA